MFWSDLRARGDRACICISAKHALYPKPISSCVSVVSVAVQGRSIGREPTHIRPALSHASVPKKAWVAGLGPTQQQPRQLQPRSPTTTTHPVKRQTAHHRPHTRARKRRAQTRDAFPGFAPSLHDLLQLLKHVGSPAVQSRFSAPLSEADNATESTNKTASQQASLLGKPACIIYKTQIKPSSLSLHCPPQQLVVLKYRCSP